MLKDTINYEEIFSDTKEQKEGKNTRFVDVTLFIPDHSCVPFLLKITNGYRGCDDDRMEWQMLENYFAGRQTGSVIRSVIALLDGYKLEPIKRAFN